MTDTTQIDALAGRVGRAIRAVEATRRETLQAYDARLRFLRSQQNDLYGKWSDPKQAELFDTGTFLSPELERVLANPHHGLR